VDDPLGARRVWERRALVFPAAAAGP